MMQSYTTIDQYIAQFPSAVQLKLQSLRDLIHALAPEATEAIKYGIPTFVFHRKNLIHFAGYQSHIGLYPGAAAIEHFSDHLQKYHTSKGTVQFPLDEPLPMKLIEAIVKWQVQHHTQAST